MTEVLKVEGLTKVYRSYKGSKTTELKAVDNVSFTVNGGEVVGFLGPNGAGKSTTIKMITGLASATSGNVYVCGHDIKKEHVEALKLIGGVIEAPDMYGSMSAKGNLEYYASLEDPSRLKTDAADARPIKEIIADRVNGVLKLVRLYERRDDKVKTFSMGMKQRLGIAQALLARPELLVLDEPANGLDPEGIKEIRDLLRTLAAEYDMAILVSSHQLAEMQLMCDRALIINKGKIVAEKSMSDLNTDVDGTVAIIVNVDRPEEAAEFIKEKLGVKCEVTDGGVKVHGAESFVLTKELVVGGFNVSGVSEEKVNLEDYFMRAVNAIEPTEKQTAEESHEETADTAQADTATDEAHTEEGGNNDVR